MCTRHNLSFCACKTAWLAPDLPVSMCPSPHLWFLDAKQRLLTRIRSLHGYQPSPVVLWMQISVISIRITSLYWSQPVPVAFACKPAPFGEELQVSIGPRLQLSSCACKTAWFAPEWQVYISSSLYLSFFFMPTVTLGPVLQVCMCPRPHLWFWAHITACLAQE